MDAPIRCVIDASVAIKLFIEEELSDQADALFAHLGSNPDTRFFVPTLFYPECANILWKYARQGECTKADAKNSLSRLMALALDRLDVALVMEDALPLALAHDISVYDACYVATARYCQVPLLTADERLARKVDDQAAEVLLLGKIKFPPGAAKE